MRYLILGLAALISTPVAADTRTTDDMRLAEIAPPADAACVNRWRSRAYLAHAADVASTIAAIETGRGTESNLIVRAMFGKRPAPHEVVLGKLAVLVPVEIWHSARLRQGDYAGVCRSYKLTAAVIGGVAMLNLRVHF